MAVAVDVGEWNDIHPLNKKAVGHRLALGAKKLVYDEETVFSGPMYLKHTIKEDKVNVVFETFGSSLTTKGGTLRGFALAGEDGKFYWADANIEGNTVLLRSTQVKKPRYVSYAWADNPDTANLYNMEGLPAVPFRTGK